MLATVWRILPCALPAWDTACSSCSLSPLESTGRFRVNSNGSRHDVWLLYRCPACGSGAKRSVHRRVHETSALSLEAYRRDDSEAALRCAFSFPGSAPVPHRIVRTPLAGPGRLELRILQPFPCRVRWDALLARELGESRAVVRKAWRGAGIPTPPRPRARSLVRDGDRAVLCLDADGRLTRGRDGSRSGPIALW